MVLRRSRTLYLYVPGVCTWRELRRGPAYASSEYALLRNFALLASAAHARKFVMVRSRGSTSNLSTS